MPSFTEDLLADRQRLTRALKGLVEEQSEVIGRLRADRESVLLRLDRSVLKLLVLLEQFGRTSSEVVLAQRDAEDVQAIANELGRKIAQNESLLHRYSDRLEAAERGDLESATRAEAALEETQGEAVKVQR